MSLIPSPLGENAVGTYTNKLSKQSTSNIRDIVSRLPQLSIATNVNQFYLGVTDLEIYSLLFEEFIQNLTEDISYKKMYLTKPTREATKAEIKRENLRYD